jgi:hypothetical protein
MKLSTALQRSVSIIFFVAIFDVYAQAQRLVSPPSKRDQQEIPCPQS